MSERTFFTIRYALPGYTFILITILVAYPKLMDLFFQIRIPQNVEFIAAFLAFFSLLGGGAIGFLVSQVWYLIYNWILPAKYKLNKARKLLEDAYGLIDNFNRQTIFLDYVVHHSNKEILTYMQRRFDLLHTLGSTLFAIFFGSLFGFLVRIDCFRTDITLEKAINSLSSLKLGMPELTTFDLGAIFIIVLFSILFFFSFMYVRKEHAMMVEVAVQNVIVSGIFPPSKARRVFTKDYFRKRTHIPKFV